MDDENLHLPQIFPGPRSGVDHEQRTTLLLVADRWEPDGLPVIALIDSGSVLRNLTSDQAAALVGPARGTPPLVEQYRGVFTRPGLRGYRLGNDDAAAGRDWSTRFVTDAARVQEDRRLLIHAADAAAGLQLDIEVEALPGGALRLRQRLTNVGAGGYVVEGLEVSLPVADRFTEILDFTGRHMRERSPQRHQLADGLWCRESRAGRPGLDSSTMMIVGEPGFGFQDGRVLAVSVATSGNSVLAVERSAAVRGTVSAGELLLPGEVVLTSGESYTSPWVFAVARTDGLDGAAQTLHEWQRSLAAHPASQPVTLNVWEAVFFDHDLAKLTRLADVAALIGVERFVLDDGWFHARRDDSAGLGDWWVDPDVWPQGLGPLVDHVHHLGMEFGLWFEPEMVNPDSDLFRAHPDWILQTGGRTPRPQRNQQVVDLTIPAAWERIRDMVDAVLSEYRIDAVKWDHNRDLLEAGSNTRSGAAAAHRQSLAFHALLDDLGRRHPHVAWESCASGGGRVDLGIVERVQRFWTSDMTDAMARQPIQRWTVQLVAPEYLGAHISSTRSHHTQRSYDLGFRAAVALFGALGVEWDLTGSDQAELDGIAGWIELYKTWRPLLHSGRILRVDTTDPQVQVNGVIAADRRSGLLSVVQLEESSHNRGAEIRVPGLDPETSYRLTWATPIMDRALSGSQALDPTGPTGGIAVSGAALATIGFVMPRRLPATAQLIELLADNRRPQPA